MAEYYSIGKGEIRQDALLKVTGKADNSLSNIGQRNVAAVKETLRAYGIPILADDTGKDYGRTLYFNAADGSMRIKSAKHGEWVF